ncbi:MAG: helix-turn-helix domain-containing protein [bacterium]
MKNAEHKTKNFAIILGKLIKHHSLSLQQLASIVGVTHSYLSKLINHRRTNPSIKIIEKISKIFQVSLAQLFGEQEIDFKSRPINLDFDEE